MAAAVAASGAEAAGEPPGTLTGPVVATGNGAVRLVTVKPEGRGTLDAEAWLRGARPAPGARLGP